MRDLFSYLRLSAFLLLTFLLSPTIYGTTDKTLSSLDPLTEQELTTAYQIASSSPQFQPGSLVSLIALDEPPKDQLAIYEKQHIRRAVMLLYTPQNNQFNKVIIDLSAHEVVSWQQLKGSQPLISKPDFALTEEIIKSDPRYLPALQKRGIKNIDEVYIDVWAIGPVTERELNDNSHRYTRAIFFYKGNSIYNYSRPIEGLSMIVDLTAKKVIKVIDTGVVPLGNYVGAYDEKSVGQLRVISPIKQTQPNGPGFTLNGSQLTWQNWRFNVSMHPQDGLVLSHIAYFDQGKWRSIISRLSLSEISVPYGDPDPNWSWRTAFDLGEYGFGFNLSPLKLGVDIPPYATLLNYTTLDAAGKITISEDVIGIYERTDGTIWKHLDSTTGILETRRKQDLVLCSDVTIGNYDYRVNYIFQQDGTIKVRVDLLGIMLSKGVPTQPTSSNPQNHASHDLNPYGHLVAANVVAPHHQHFFNFRIDFDVDGINNSAYELNTYSMPKGPNNPEGNAFMMKHEPLQTEQQAQRDLNLATDRKWVIVNPNVINELGSPVGYAIIPAENTVPMLDIQSETRQKAWFINHHFWITRFSPEQLRAAGDFPNQAEDDLGLRAWTNDNESIDNTDIVVWYTIGVTHIPRPEEWPIMPASQLSFKILPVGFFTKNPALNLPAE